MRATLKQQLTSNCPVSPLSLLSGELKSSPLFCVKPISPERRGVTEKNHRSGLSLGASIVLPAQSPAEIPRVLGEALRLSYLVPPPCLRVSW